MTTAGRREDKDLDLIRITHYINPHNFWFKHESDYAYNPEQQQFQLELNNFCEQTFGRGNLTSGIYTPRRVGELVAVFYFQLSRWIRAEVDEIQEDLSGQIHCNLWAIDEGVPLKTSCRYVKPLPDKFAQFEGNVKHGGLEGVLPAESGYDYLQGETVTKMSTSFAPGVVQVFGTCIEEAVSIRFCNQKHHRIDSKHMYFGSMQITSHQNVTNDAKDLLRKAGGRLVLLVDNDQFYEKFPYLRTLDMKRFEDNEFRENMKYFGNTFRPEYTGRRTVKRIPREEYFQNDPIIKQAREKIFEWDKRNEASSSIGNWDNPSYPEKSLDLENDPLFREYRNSHTQSHNQYKQLINESLSDDNDQLTFDSKSKDDGTEKSQKTPSVSQVPKGEIYDKSFSDIQERLKQVKFRRRETVRKQQEQQDKANKAAQPAQLNFIPAGFSMGQVDLSTGSAVLGAANETDEEVIRHIKYQDHRNRNHQDYKQNHTREKSNRTYNNRRENSGPSFGTGSARRFDEEEKEEEEVEQW
ncbi:uncharacterized protein LOC129750576 [Uranotaenia lowii]|uniref:uncharacterized protein LOC129750576 n=1 Tax=Uranotaenia lowii TaxID=190385 RepID=UPI0024783CBE|nr:uncharacterized protein LOC129750576 [Uranotaenia lowii]